MKKVYTLIVGILMVAANVGQAIQLDWNEVGMAPYTGAGFRTENFNLRGDDANYIRVRVPQQCALQIYNVQALDARGGMQVSLVNSLTDGMFSYFIYNVVAGRVTPRPEQIRVGVNSAFFYTPAHGCGIRVYTAVYDGGIR